MAEGSISFVEGLGIKAQDSNELRRKQTSSQKPKCTVHSGLEEPNPLTSVHSQTTPTLQDNSSMSSQMEFGSINLPLFKTQSPSRMLSSSNQSLKSLNPNFQSTMSDFSDSTPSRSLLPGNPSNTSPTGVASHSPQSGTARKLQQALFEEGLILEAEERTRHVLVLRTDLKTRRVESFSL